MRAGNFLPVPRDNPRNGGSRGWGSWRMRRSRIRLAPPPSAFLVTFWASKKSLAAGAAKHPCENKKTLSSRDWDESVSFASWCHPISERPGRSLWTPCCGGGAAPVSRPAGGAVFGRVRLRGVLSTWGRSPWDLSLSGGIPVTHAPSWR